jgi:hypothetical protein
MPFPEVVKQKDESFGLRSRGREFSEKYLSFRLPQPGQYAIVYALMFGGIWHYVFVQKIKTNQRDIAIDLRCNYEQA